MNIAIVGSRSLENKPQAVRDAIERAPFFDTDEDITIVSGGASGVDTIAAHYANEKLYDTLIIEPNWQKYGPAAGPKRNTRIVDNADSVIAVWDGSSNGTADTIKKVLDAGIPLYVEQP